MWAKKYSFDQKLLSVVTQLSNWQAGCRKEEVAGVMEELERFIASNPDPRELKRARFSQYDFERLYS